MPFDGRNLNEAAAHLLLAKRYIEEHGWCHGRLEDAAGARCVIGAIWHVPSYAGAAAAEVFARALGLRGAFRVRFWNDDRRRTLEDVYAAFDAAIALAMAEERAK